jgi:NAD(P)-dependent dehydrogenase (short-subunit alcohol dehydrogenase family)
MSEISEISDDQTIPASDPFGPRLIPKDTHAVVVLTGASTGIGFATARYLAERGDFVFAGVRRAEDAHKLREAHPTHIAPLLLDICDDTQVSEAAERVEQALREAGRSTLSALINNAGVALGGPLLEIPISVLQRQLEVNVTSQLRVTQAFAPLLGASAQAQGSPGRVIMVSSVSGVRAMPFVGPYTASKFALEGLSDSLRMELLPFGVDVVVVQPGPISTEIWDKAPTPDSSPYQGSFYEPALKRFYKLFVEGGRKGLPPQAIAEVISTALHHPKPRPRYVKTPGYLTRYLIPRLMPTRRFDRVVGKMLGLIKRS